MRRPRHPAMRRMQSFKSKAILGALSFLALLPLALRSQSPIQLTVEDPSSAALAGATVFDSANHLLGRTDASGSFSVICAAPCRISISAPGFASQTLTVAASATIQLQPAAGAEQVTVTAYRAPLGDLESPATTRVLSRQTLATTAGITLDDQLRQLPGVELFRRSPSLVANPTSQGISLRGLGSTSASRGLSSLKTTSRSTTRLAAGSTGRSSLISPSRHRAGPRRRQRSLRLKRHRRRHQCRSRAPHSQLRRTHLHLRRRRHLRFQRARSNEIRAMGRARGSGHARHRWLHSGVALPARPCRCCQQRPQPERACSWPSTYQGPLRLFARISRLQRTAPQRHALPVQRHAPFPLCHRRRLAERAQRRPRPPPLRLRRALSARPSPAFPTRPTPPIPPAPTAAAKRPRATPTSPPTSLAPQRIGASLSAPACSFSPAQIRTTSASGIASKLTAPLPRSPISTIISATPAPTLKLMATHRAWTVHRLRPHRLVSRTTTATASHWTGSTWTPSAPRSLRSAANDSLIRVLASRARLARTLGALRFRLSRLPRAHAQRALPLHAGRQPAHPPQQQPAQRARHWLGSRPRLAALLGQSSAPATFSPRSIAPSLRSPSIPTPRPFCSCARISARSRAAASRSITNSPRFVGSRVDGGYQYAHAVVSRGTLDYGKWIPEVARNLATLNLRASRPRLGTLSLQSRLSGRMFDDDANTYLLAGYFRLDAYASHNFGCSLRHSLPPAKISPANPSKSPRLPPPRSASPAPPASASPSASAPPRTS